MIAPKLRASTAPVRQHLDRRAAAIIAANVGADDELLTTREVSDWIGNSTQWLEIGRSRGYGPPFIRVSQRVIRYRRSDVLKWLSQRTYTCTSEYAA
jgi:predicted DNA-binding transcriptional regulator AlpA